MFATYIVVSSIQAAPHHSFDSTTANAQCSLSDTSAVRCTVNFSDVHSEFHIVLVIHGNVLIQHQYESTSRMSNQQLHIACVHSNESLSLYYAVIRFLDPF